MREEGREGEQERRREEVRAKEEDNGIEIIHNFVISLHSKTQTRTNINTSFPISVTINLCHHSTSVNSRQFGQTTFQNRSGKGMGIIN